MTKDQKKGNEEKRYSEAKSLKNRVRTEKSGLTCLITACRFSLCRFPTKNIRSVHGICHGR